MQASKNRSLWIALILQVFLGILGAGFVYLGKIKKAVIYFLIFAFLAVIYPDGFGYSFFPIYIYSVYDIYKTYKNSKIIEQYGSLENYKEKIEADKAHSDLEKMIKENYGSWENYKKAEKRRVIEEEKEKIRERHENLRIREQAEKELFGRGRIKRQSFAEDERKAIFDKFHNQCAICGAKEGLHIHHKDKDRSNNSIRNLIVLCGLCHKKIHMKA